MSALTDLGPRGKALWKQLLDQDAALRDQSNPRRQIALEAARTADLVDRLEAEFIDAEPIIEGKSGLTAHPLLNELRQQRTTMTRLIAALRLPDEATGRRPQVRGGARGAYAKVPANVSSLERMRKAAGA